MANFNRELPLEHIRAEMRAMRWLYTLGYSFEEIQKFSWREVDEFDRKIRMDREVFFAKYELKTGKIDIKKERKHMEIPIDDENVAVFFRYSRIYCQWCFVCKKPLSWRREKSVDSLFPLCKIEEICMGQDYEADKTHKIDALTNEDKFARIKLSKENIESTETRELKRGGATKEKVTWHDIGMHV